MNAKGNTQDGEDVWDHETTIFQANNGGPALPCSLSVGGVRVYWFNLEQMGKVAPVGLGKPRPPLMYHKMAFSTPERHQYSGTTRYYPSLEVVRHVVVSPGSRPDCGSIPQDRVDLPHWLVSLKDIHVAENDWLLEDRVLVVGPGLH